MSEPAYLPCAIGAAVSDAAHAAQHPWCTEVSDLLDRAEVPAHVANRVLSEVGHVLHNDAPQSVTVAQLLSLGAKVELDDTCYKATVFVAGIGGDVEGQGTTVEEAVVDAYARKRQVDGHPIVERVAKMLHSAEVSWRVADQVAAVLKRIRLRYSVQTQGSVPTRLAVSPNPCPMCARGRLNAVRYTDTLERDGQPLRVINLEGDYCTGCGETSVSPAAARRNEHRIVSAASEARQHNRIGLR